MKKQAPLFEKKFYIRLFALLAFLVLSDTQSQASKQEGEILDAQDILVKGNTLYFAGEEFKCAVGKNGITPQDQKREGDGKTPAGTYSLVEAWFRPDRIDHVVTDLPMFKITDKDGWCDASDDINYNKHVELPYPVSHEELYRQDHLYDLFAVINYNYPDAKPGLGSAIFFHIAREKDEGFGPTAGCVALKRDDLEYVLSKFNSSTGKFIIEE